MELDEQPYLLVATEPESRRVITEVNAYLSHIISIIVQVKNTTAERKFIQRPTV